MTFDEMLNLTPEEFAASWNKDDEIIDVCKSEIQDGLAQRQKTTTQFEL
ncbi:hypothetical protein HWD32_gp36 [Gordonia phage Secretariat]|uniref:Uncharacterized protein n=1 Tax=Gordonia phage Secretariat TaxID=2725616 RepID=A0A6M3SUK4_9CAUD|nr:hypothetical protein HWD32_gp36 [Gordonia phage Secretariat]QJD49613.1 hypothetical protein SEA_SECRETARIAT_36 [Gordonia phage Secretariat]